MASLDQTELLAPVSGPNPAGKNLEYTPELSALEEAVADPIDPGLPGVEVTDTRNWRQAASLAKKLLTTSKDLRVAVTLARALLHAEGLAAFCEGVALIHGLATSFWDGVYPLADEYGDIQERLSAIATLWSLPVLNKVKTVPLISVRGLGEFSLNDVLIANGQLKPKAGAAAPTPDLIRGAFGHAPLEELKATSQRVSDAKQHLQALKTFVELQESARAAADEAAQKDRNLRVPQRSLSVAPLEDVLGQIAKLFAPYIVEAEPAVADEGVSDQAAEPVSADAPSRPRQGIVGEIRSRDDVTRMLDKICAYYEQHEPASPVPLLLTRAKRLVNLSFLEIMQDLADKGLPQVEMISGIRKDSDDD